mgnify:CR=1 FL=1
MNYSGLRQAWFALVSVLVLVPVPVPVLNSLTRGSLILYSSIYQNININIISSLPCLIRMRELWEVVFLHTMNYARDVVKYYHAEINIMYASPVANISSVRSVRYTTWNAAPVANISSVTTWIFVLLARRVSVKNAMIYQGSVVGNVKKLHLCLALCNEDITAS